MEEKNIDKELRQEVGQISCPTCGLYKTYLIRIQKNPNAYILELFCDLCGAIQLLNLEFKK